MKILLLLVALLTPAQAWAVTLATDDFNRADANPIGGNWTTVPSGPTAIQIVGNEVRGTAAFNPNGAYYNAVTPPDDQYAQIKIVTTSGDFPCPAIRISTTDYSLYAVCPSSGAAINIVKWVAGTYTNLVAVGSAWSDGGTIKAQAQGTTIKGFFNGAEEVSTTDASLASGRFGFVVPSAASVADSEADDFEGGDFTAAASGPRRRVIVVE